MGYRHLLIMTILDAVIVLHNPSTILASPIPTPTSNLNWGDMEDFIKFMRMYESSSQMVNPIDHSSASPMTMAKMLHNSVLSVSN